MAYEVVMSYHLHMPSYFLGTFTEYPFLRGSDSPLPIKKDLQKKFLQVFFYILPYCFGLFLEIAVVQTFETFTVTSFVFSHFMNCVMDSIQIQCFGTCSDTLLVFASA